MSDKQTLYLMKVQEKGAISAVDGMNLVYGSKEMKPLSNGLFAPSSVSTLLNLRTLTVSPPVTL